MKTMKRCVYKMLNSALLLSLGALGLTAPNPAFGQTTATVSVDCSVSQGTLPRTEKYNNVADWDAFAGERKADVRFYNAQGLHGQVYRVWLRDDDLYDKKTDTYSHKKYADYLADISQLSDSILVNISGMGMPKEWGIPPEQCGPILGRIIKDLKRGFPKIKYIEATNEPDYGYKKAIIPDTYYNYYKAFYQAVNEANAELKPDVPLQVGGPSVAQFDLTWLRPFLDAYKNDPAPDKRLDFISYHAYFRKPESAYIMFNENPSMVKDQRAQLDAELSSRGINTNIPAFVTETGMYPGPSFNDLATMKNDHLRQAAGMASLFYWYLDCPNVYPFNWVLRHRKEGRKDQLISRDAVGSPMVYTEKFTPYGNMMVMQSKMKTTRVSAVTSSVIDSGKGLYALASADDSGASVMLWNYQRKMTGDFNTSVEVKNLPASFTGKNIKARIYRIDSKTSNFHADIDHCNLQMVEEKIISKNNSYSTSLYMEPNSLQLVILEPTDASAPL
jgi:Glycosyl hydrolases family 39